MTKKQMATQDLQEVARVSFSKSLKKALERLTLDNLEELRVAFATSREDAVIDLESKLEANE